MGIMYGHMTIYGYASCIIMPIPQADDWILVMADRGSKSTEYHATHVSDGCQMGVRWVCVGDEHGESNRDDRACDQVHHPKTPIRHPSDTHLTLI